MGAKHHLRDGSGKPDVAAPGLGGKAQHRPSKWCPEEEPRITDNILLKISKLRLVFQHGTDGGTGTFFLSDSVPEPVCKFKLSLANSARFINSKASLRATLTYA
jgi:hypothetical protein